MNIQSIMILPTLLLMLPAALAGTNTNPASAPAATEGDSPRFEVAEGTRLLKTVTWRQELSLDEMGSTRSGSDLMRENVGGWLSSSMTKVYLDEYVEVADGRPQQVRRLIRNLSGHGKVNISGGRGRVEERTVFTSPMKGLVLLLTWVEAEGEYGRMYDELDGDELLLKDISGDVDFVYMLPSDEVAEGDTWEIALPDLRYLLAPGGNLAALPGDEGFFPRMMEVGIGGDLADVLGNRITGTATATYAGVRVVDGRRMGVIDVALDIASKRDRTGTYSAGMQREERQEAATLKHVNLDFTLAGSGELLWDLEAGHFESFELEGRETFRAEVFKTRSEGAELFDSTQVVAFSGDLKLDYTQRTMKSAAEQALEDAEKAASEPQPVAGEKKKRGKKR